MKYSDTLLRFSFGYVFFHFGFLKFFSDLSPAELLADQTIMKMSLYFLDAHTALILLGVLEVLIGIGFMFNIKPKWTLGLFLFHMAGTFLPLFVIPEITFKIFPFAPTLEGQYILKNVVYVAVGLTILYPKIKSQETQKAET